MTTTDRERLAKLERVAEAARTLVDKLDLIEPALNSLHCFAAVHGHYYHGPNYGQDVCALREALSDVSPDPHHSEQTDHGR